MSEYVPFGDEWKKEVMRLKKSEIVDMLAKVLRETASRPTPLAPDGETHLCGGKYYTDKVLGEVCCRCQAPRR